ncbi:PepSY domain-containing protein, partial [Ancylobacter vacuolatus]
MPSPPPASAPNAVAPDAVAPNAGALNAAAPKARRRRRLASVAVPVLAGFSALASLPAQAQVYFRPYGGVYVERYYEPPPAYYPPPPPPTYYPPPPQVYAPPPAYGAPGRLPLADVTPLLRSMGMTGIGRPRVDGPTYVVDATARSGARMRVRIDAYSGEVIAMHPIGQAPVAAPA